MSALSNPGRIPHACSDVRAAFSDYLDGQVSGVRMALLATHLDRCQACAQEFARWRTMQAALSALAPLHAPRNLQAQLRHALASERDRGTHLSLRERCVQSWRARVAPFAVQAVGGFSLALVLVAGLSWIFAAPLAVEANDDNQAHLIAPHYLYSQVPPQPIVTRNDAPVLVEAKVDTDGRVYDYNIIAGPSDPEVRVRIEENLLSSVFRPAMVFGEPVRGHVMLTYSGVSVHG